MEAEKNLRKAKRGGNKLEAGRRIGAKTWRCMYTWYVLRTLGRCNCLTLAEGLKSKIHMGRRLRPWPPSKGSVSSVKRGLHVLDV